MKKLKVKKGKKKFAYKLGGRVADSKHNAVKAPMGKVSKTGKSNLSKGALTTTAAVMKRMQGM